VADTPNPQQVPERVTSATNQIIRRGVTVAMLVVRACDILGTSFDASRVTLTL